MKKVVIFLVLFCLIVLTACGNIVQPVKPTESAIKPMATESPMQETLHPPKPTLMQSPPVISVGLPTPKPEVTETPPVVLIDEVECPLPMDGDWYEWGLVGNYSANPSGYANIYYSEKEDLLIRGVYGDRIVVSRLDGYEKQIPISSYGLYATVLYYDGWIYYLENLNVWKTKLDGSETQRLSEIAISKISIYDGLLYLIDTDKFVSVGLDGENQTEIDLPGDERVQFLFENGYVYYRSGYIDTIGEFYRYNLKTGEWTILYTGYGWPTAVKDGWIFYRENGTICRTNGQTTEKLVSGEYISKYNIYRNYLLYFDANMLRALNLDTMDTYDLSAVTGSGYIYVMQDSVFIDDYYQITFENGMASFWELKWRDAEPDNSLEEGGPGE